MKSFVTLNPYLRWPDRGG